MRLELTGRHLTITPGMRRTVQKHLARLERVFAHTAVSAQIVVTHEKSRVHVEFTLHARGDRFLHGEGTAADWERALITATEKIERQAEKLVGKRKAMKRRGGAVPVEAAPPGPADGAESRVRIIRARRYAVKPMSVDDAAMEVGEGQNAFLVFRNASTEAITVLYRRPDGHLGLIEPEA